MSIWLGAGPGDDAQDAVKRLYAEYDYQQNLFPERLRGSAGGSGGPTAEDPDGTPAEDPDGTPGAEPGGSGSGSSDAAADEASHPRGRTWSRGGWREDLRREVEQHRGRAEERGDPERRERDLSGRGYSGGGALASLLKVLVWVVLAVCAVTIVALLVRARGSRAAELAPGEPAGVESPPAALDAPRSEAETLADQGRYDEAVHLLLLKTIEALVRTRPGGLPEAWTSREIQREMPMVQSARAPFGALVGTVEASLFGGRPVDEPAWTRCLERFRTFESAYSTGRA